MESIAYCAPPEYTNTPPIGHTMLWSVLRTDRTDPTRSGVCELKIAARRVYPPSTTSSYTTSACSTPYFGWLSCLLSILTVTAQRRRAPVVSGSPVSGATAGAFCVVGVIDSLLCFPPPHAASAT